MTPPTDFRPLFDGTRECADHALANPVPYAAYKAKVNAALRATDPFFNKVDFQPCELAVAPDIAAGLEGLGAELYTVVEKVLQMYANGLPELLDFFPQYILFRPFMRRQLAAWQEYGRYDFIVDNTGAPIFIETNAAMASGFLPFDIMTSQFVDTAPDFLRLDGMTAEAPSRAEVFAESVRCMLRSFTADDGIFAVLVDENRKLHEVDMIVSVLKRAGLNVAVADVGDLIYRNGYRLSPDGPQVIGTFNKFRVFGAQHHWSNGAPSRYHTFLQGIQDNAFLTINNFACLTIAEDKSIFAAMRLPSVQAALTAKQRAFVEAHTPDSYILQSDAEMADGASLTEALVRDRGEWILKPRNDYRGTGAYSGRDHDDTTWRALIDELLAGETAYLAQRRVDAFMFPIAVAEGKDVVRQDCRLLGGLYYRHLGISGVLGRVSPSEIANVSSGKAYVLPTVQVPSKAA